MTRLPIKGILGILVLVAGLGAVLAISTGNLDLRSLAFTGARFDSTILNNLQSNANPIPAVSNNDNPSKVLFTKLLATYPTADVQNIDNPELELKGVVFMQYDESLKKTFIFSRIQNLPRLSQSVLEIWLAKTQTSALQKAGVAEFVSENGKSVAYSVFTKDGNLGAYKHLIFSYDPLTNLDKPGGAVITVDF